MILKEKINLSKLKVELNKKYTYSIACIIMFLIGAPLGGIIKKRGIWFTRCYINYIVYFLSHNINNRREISKKKCSRLFVWNMGTYNFIFNVRALLTYKMQKERI